MHKMIATAGLTALVLVPPAVTAQPVTVRQACKTELEQHCSGVEPGEGRLRGCVKEHFAEFSEQCKAALLSGVVVVKTCKGDVQKTCAGVEPGGGRIQACMKDHFAEYSEACKQAIITAKFGRR